MKTGVDTARSPLFFWRPVIVGVIYLVVRRRQKLAHRHQPRDLRSLVVEVSEQRYARSRRA
jgi:hypothetical protein